MITKEDLLAAGFRPAAPYVSVEPATDSLMAGIGAHLDRVRANGGNIQNLPPLPSRPFVGTPVPGNPFHPVVQSMKPRRAVLTVDEVVKGYNAVSFAMREHGTVMNAHITLAWRLMGIEDHAVGTRLFTRVKHEWGKWLAVGSPSLVKFRRRMTKRAEGGGTEFMYFYVHENARDQGFHTHVLTFIPPTQAAQFKAWARACLHRLSGYKGMHEDALHITVDNSRTESQRVAWCWARFRYLTKTLDPTWRVRGDEREWLEGRAIFKPDRPFVEAAPLHCAQAASGSRNIWTKAQADAGFVSRYRVTGELDRLYDGSELNERRRDIELAEYDARIVDLTETLNL